MQKLVIVSGATGTFGRAYLEYFKGQPNTRCVSITRTLFGEHGIQNILTDLLDAESVADHISNLSLADISEVVLVHPVGKFKFEKDGLPDGDCDGDGIDDEVYNSNVLTFQNIATPLLKRIEAEGRPVPVLFCAFGSISDKYKIKFWNSYTESKNILRKWLGELVCNNPGKVRGLFINVSTTNTTNENILRPFADKEKWLSPEEVVERSVPFIESAHEWKEVEVYKPASGFGPEYYLDTKRVLEKWNTEMGRKLR